MEKLIELLTALKDACVLENGCMDAYLAETYLDKNDQIDIYFLRDSLEENITKAQLQKAYFEVFDAPLPSKLTYIKAETSISKQDFLENIYEPAKYRNVRSWINHTMQNYGLMLNRKDLFDWIMSTAKPRTYLGDLYDKID